MKKALIIGRFAPFHKMHLALVETVKAMGYQPIFGLMDAPCAIPTAARQAWLEPHGSVITLPMSAFSYDQISVETLPQVDLVAGSNPELLTIAKALNIPHFLWDPEREAWALDADAILQDPLTHWFDMPAQTRSTIQRRITFVGPESVGKSWFAKDMSARFGGPHIPEYGRPHEKYRPKMDYTSDELALLAERHGASRTALSRLAGPVVFEDTDELMTAVWSEMLLDKRSPNVETRIVLPSLYILYHWDTPWEDDKIRYFARADLRRQFYDRIEAMLNAHHAPYAKVGGTWEEREAQTLKIVEAERAKVKF